MNSSFSSTGIQLMKRKTFSLLGSSVAELILAKVFFGFGHPASPQPKHPQKRMRGSNAGAIGRYGHSLELRESQHLTRRGQRRARHHPLVYCHECSVAGGADRPIYHQKPVCVGYVDRKLLRGGW